MIFVLIVAYVLHATFIRRSHARLVLALIPVFAVSQLPSTLKEHLVLNAGGSYIYPQDPILLGMLALLLLDARSRTGFGRQSGMGWLLLVYAALNCMLLAWVVSAYGFDAAYVRQTLFGTLWLFLSLARLDLAELGRNGALGKAFVMHNLLILASATMVALTPGLNDNDSELASFLGFTSTAGEGGSLILVSAISAVMCLVSIWYHLFIERRGLLSPFVMLPVGLIVVSAHRIDYLALALLLLIWMARTSRSRIRRPAWMTGSLVLLYTIAAIQGIRVIGVDTLVDLGLPFLERATSLFEGNQTGTVDDRLQQYAYFFDGYLSSHEPARYLLGEGYVPTFLRDDFYQFVQPHNFLLNVFVNGGLVAVIFFSLFIGMVVARHLRSPFLLPLGLLMVTQLTDAGFPVYPNSAYVALLLALMQACPGVSAITHSPPSSARRILASAGAA